MKRVCVCYYRFGQYFYMRNYVALEACGKIRVSHTTPSRMRGSGEETRGRRRNQLRTYRDVEATGTRKMNVRIASVE